MKMKTSLRLLCAILMIAVLVMSLPISTFAAAVNASLLSKGSYKEISVSDFAELKAALEADDKAIITLENDIVKDIRPKVFLYKPTAERHDYDPYEDFDEGEYDICYYDETKEDGHFYLDGEDVSIYEDPQIKIKGDKILNLNGYDINVLDNSNVAFALRNLQATSDFYRHTLASHVETYQRTLLTVTNGSELTIRDNTPTPGTIHYDAWMITTPSESQVHYIEYAVRDIVSVENATLVVENGVLEAGRSKEQWIFDGSYADVRVEDRPDGILADDEYIEGWYHHDYAYQQVWGSAIHLASEEAEVYINNGSFFGRGLCGKSVVAIYDKDNRVSEYGFTGAFRDAVIDGKPGTVVINGGFFNAKGGADIFYFSNGGEIMHDRDLNAGGTADVTIRGGSYRIQKVDYIRCLDANMTNDTDMSTWIFLGVGAVVGMLLSLSTLASGPAILGFISWSLSYGLVTAGSAAGSAGIAALVQSPATPIVYEGNYGRMNIKKEYLKDINGRARFTVDYDKDNDSELDDNMTVFDYVPSNIAEDFGVFLRIDPAHGGEAEYLSVNYGSKYENSKRTEMAYNPDVPMTVSANYNPFYSNIDMLDDHSISYFWTISDGTTTKTHTTTGTEDSIDPFKVLGVTPKAGEEYTVTCRVTEYRSGLNVNAYSYTTEPLKIMVTDAPVVPEALPGGDIDVEVIYPTSGDATDNKFPVSIVVKPTPAQISASGATLENYTVIYTNNKGEGDSQTNKIGEFTLSDLDKQLNIVAIEIKLTGKDFGTVTLRKEIQVFVHSGNEMRSYFWNDDYTTIFATGDTCRLDNEYFENENQPACPWYKMPTDRFDWYKMSGVDENGEPKYTKMDDISGMPASATVVDENGVYAFGVTLDSGDIVLARPVQVIFDSWPLDFTVKSSSTDENRIMIKDGTVISEPTFTAIPEHSNYTDGIYSWEIVSGPDGWRSSGLSYGKTDPNPWDDQNIEGKFTRTFARDMDKDDIIPGEYTFKVYRYVVNKNVSSSCDIIKVVVDRTSTSGSIYIKGEETGDYTQLLSKSTYPIKFAPSDKANYPILLDTTWKLDTLVGSDVVEFDEERGYITPKNPGRVRITATCGDYSDSVIIDVPITKVDLITPDTIKDQQLKDLVKAPANAPYTVEVSDYNGNINPTTVVESGYPFIQVKITPKDGYVLRLTQETERPYEWYAVNNSIDYGFKTESGLAGAISKIDRYKTDFSYSKEGPIDGTLYQGVVCKDASAKIGVTFKYVPKDGYAYERNVKVSFNTPAVSYTYDENALGLNSEYFEVISSRIEKVNDNAKNDRDYDNDGAVEMSGKFEEGQLYRLYFLLSAKDGVLLADQPLVFVNDSLAVVYVDVDGNTNGFLGDKYIMVYYYFYAADEPEVVDTLSIDIKEPEANKQPQNENDAQIGIGGGASTYGLLRTTTPTVRSTDALEINSVTWFVDLNGNGQWDYGETHSKYFNKDGTFKKGVAYSVWIQFSIKENNGSPAKIVIGNNAVIYLNGKTATSENCSLVYTFEPTAFATDCDVSVGAETIDLGTAELGYTTAPSQTFTVTSTGTEPVTEIMAMLYYGAYFDISVNGMDITVTAKTGLKETFYGDVIIIKNVAGQTLLEVPVQVSVENTNHTHDYSVWVYDDEYMEGYHFKACSICGDYNTSESAMHYDPDHPSGGGVYDTCDKVVCFECGYVMQEAKGHNYVVSSDNLRAEAQNCQELDSYWYSCQNCGKSAGDDPNATEFFYYAGEETRGEHKFADEWQSDGFAHYHGCTVEGCSYIKDDMALHEGGTATCSAKAVCSVCNLEYGPLADHDYEGQPNSYYSDAGHAPECKVCGHHDVLTPHTPDRAEATTTDAIKCKDCEYIITPVIGHVCGNGIKIDGKAASCETGDGWKDYYKCSGCNKFYADEACTVEIADLLGWMRTDGKIAAHTPNADDGDCTTPVTCSGCGAEIIAAKSHSFTGEWQKDADGHWHDCENDGCNVTDTKAAHTDGNNDGKCDACAYDMPSTPGTDTPGTDTPGTDTPDTDKPTDNTDKATEESDTDKADETEAPVEKGCGGCGSSAALSAVALVAIFGTALVVKKKED